MDVCKGIKTHDRGWLVGVTGGAGIWETVDMVLKEVFVMSLGKSFNLSEPISYSVM